MKNTIIKDTIEMLEDDIKRWAKLYGEELLTFPGGVSNLYKKQIATKVFLLNLVKAYDVNISEFIPESKEKTEK